MNKKQYVVLTLNVIGDKMLPEHLPSFSLKITLLDKNSYPSHYGCKNWDTWILSPLFRVRQTTSHESDPQVGFFHDSQNCIKLASGLISFPAFLSFFSSCLHVLERSLEPHLYNSGLFPPSEKQGWHSSLGKQKQQVTVIYARLANFWWPICRLLCKQV